MEDQPQTAGNVGASSFDRPPDSEADRRAHGKAARKRVKRSAHAEYAPRPDRPDPVSLIVGQESTRVQELLPLRHERMLASPFTFFRGAALLMASDLSERPTTGLTVQLCGDAHLSNFGIYAAPDRRLVFSVNDFDESLPGPFEWDVERLAASFAVAGRARDFSRKRRRRIVEAAARSYREGMEEFAQQRALDVWYSRMDVDDIEARYGSESSKRQRRSFAKVTTKARSKNSLRAASKLTRVVDGRLRFISNPPVIVPADELLGDHDAQAVTEAAGAVFEKYRESLPDDRQHLLENFHYVDLARKVVGVGSVGTRAWVLLLQGRHTDDPLVLQLKEAEASVLEAYVGASDYDNHGERVVAGQRLMQSASDIMLGWTSSVGTDGIERDYYVRQLWDQKGSADVDGMRPSAMTIYAQVCGLTLARAHARSGDAPAIAGYLGSGTNFDRAMASFAEDYADQNELDYAAMKAAVDDGRLAMPSDTAS
ncbi:MAG TPA: DUF2252 domain-containing protein [Nitriliruptoraceae bacterium]|nr:DUF2252 domain-containing protein [Nitriliruptoraceae bacterium]